MTFAKYNKACWEGGGERVKEDTPLFACFTGKCINVTLQVSVKEL